MAASPPVVRQRPSTASRQAWASIEDPLLLLRGAESDLLSAQTAQAMVQRGRQARCVEFAGVGHAPMLMQPDQVDCVRDFLLGG